MYRIKLTQGDRVRYADKHQNLVIKSLAHPWQYQVAAKQIAATMQRHNPSYTVEVEPIPADEQAYYASAT